jgi:predicted double-glycine peptidase
MLWLELLIIPLLVILGIFLGRRATRLPGRWWLVGFFLPIVIVTLVILGHRSVRMSFVPVVSWVVAADINPLLMALIVPSLLSTILPRLPQRRQRLAVGAFLWFAIGYFSCLPILAPLIVRPALASAPTKIDPRGVCLQSHTYTCGPAAAVTVLRTLGFPAEEGPLALESCSAPGVGTDPHRLAAAIAHRYAAAGLRCDYRLLETLDVLPAPAIADLHSSLASGHYVAVLEVTPDFVVVGDPLSGRERLTRSEFLAEWTGAAHVFTIASRPPTASAPAMRPQE